MVEAEKKCFNCYCFFFLPGEKKCRFSFNLKMHLFSSLLIVLWVGHFVKLYDLEKANIKVIGYVILFQSKGDETRSFQFVITDRHMNALQHCMN